MDARLPTTYTKEIVDELASHARELLAVERACVFLRDGERPVPAAVASDHDADDLSPRVPALDEAIAGEVLSRHVPVLTGAAAGAPIWWNGKVRAAMTVASVDPGRALAARELDTLCELSQLGGLALEHARTRHRLERVMDAGVDVLARTVDLRDAYDARRSEEMAGLARDVGRTLGLDAGDSFALELAARLHDLGKLSVPDQILRKPGPLTRQEWDVIRRHPQWGAEMLAAIPGLERVAEIVKGHHERFDGAGYPGGLSGAEIPLPSRILSVCDAYQAMVSNRPYRRALGAEAALRELREQSGFQFDPDAVEALTQSAENLALSRA